MQTSNIVSIPKGFNLSVQGNVGAGKTTFITQIAAMFPCLHIIKEPIEKWENIQGDNLLELYYHDRKRWSFTFQSYAMLSRIPLWRQAQQSLFRLSQRSVLADRYVFGQLMIEKKMMMPVEIEVYQKLGDQLTALFPLQGIIYLECSPEQCLNRMKKRNRLNEQSTPIQFMRELEQKHLQLIQNNPQIKVLTINTQKYNILNEDHRKEIKRMVFEFLTQLGGTL